MPRPNAKRHLYFAHHGQAGWKRTSLVVIVIVSLLLNACGKPREQREPPQLALPSTEDRNGPEGSFSNEYGESGAINLDYIADGYVLARCTAQRDACLSILKDDTMWSEKLPADNEWYIYPLTMGDGEYTVQLHLREQGDTFRRMLDLPFNARLDDPNEPFLMPNFLAQYDESSSVVAFSRQLYQESKNNKDMADDLFQWLRSNIDYDEDFSQSEEFLSGFYIPDLDNFLADKQGVCSDYTSAFAAIMRIAGIPCQIVYGDVAQGSDGIKYHAWNHVWLEDKDGVWSWWRYDSTFGYPPMPLDGRADGNLLYAGQSCYGEPSKIF